MGHSTIEVTERYAHLALAGLTPLMTCAGPRLRRHRAWIAHAPRSRTKSCRPGRVSE